MKQLAIILSLVISSAAQAQYKVGDTVVYAASMSNQSFDLKYEVQSVDTNNDMMTITQSILMNGTVLNETTTNGTITETQQNELIFDACMQMPAQTNPKLESITVPAGSFNTCHLTMMGDDGATLNGYYAKVLFGIVKMTKTGDANHPDVSMELKSVTKL